MCLCVCVISNLSTSKKPYYVLDFTKLTLCCIKHTQWSPSYTKVPKPNSLPTIHFFIERKFTEPKIAIEKTRQLTIQTFISYLIYFGARKAFYEIMQHNKIWFVLYYRNVSFREIIIMWETKYLNKLRNFAKYFAKSFSMQNNSERFSSI